MKKKILIIGESARDIFVYCKAERLAPDLPIPVLRKLYQTTNAGMAKNVELNIKNISNICDLYTNQNWKKVTKTRYMDEKTNHAFIRVDTDHTMNRVDVKKIPFKEYSIVAISDYNKGFLTEADIKHICDNHQNVFVDTKKILGKWIENAKFIKINNYEYERSINFISKKIKDKIICTRGEFGAEYKSEIYPVEKVEVKDTSGAGDSFFAALLIKYFETNNIRESIKFANICTSKVVQQRGVTLIKKP